MKMVRITQWHLSAVFILLVLAVGSTRAAQVRLAVDTNSSSLELTLCVQGTCDTDTSPLRGSVVAALDNNENPTQIALRNFDLQATEDYVLLLDYGFLVGQIDANVQNLRVYHAAPGVTNPLVSISAGQYTFLDVPYALAGAADYNAHGLLICDLVQNAGLPCTSNIDLSTLGTNTIDQLPGTIQIANGIMTVNLTFDFDVPFNPANPSLGNIVGHAVVRASGPITTGLVPLSSDWRYSDDGSDQGTAWRQTDFPDSTWALGPAQLGYGDGDEETVINGGPVVNRFPTTYFRHAFNVPNPSIYTNLALRVLRDDGVIVYLNDMEI